MSESLPSKVQAIGINKTGDFDAIEKFELPFPQNQPGNVLVKVQYAGVNFSETYYRKGLYSITSFPQVLGTEAAGEIIALPTDERVLDDNEFKLRKFAVGATAAFFGLGAFAEYVSVPWTKVFPLPDGVSTKTAAAALIQGGTALTFITEAYSVQKGDIILVHTVAGGLGLLFAQLIKARGATVIGTTSTPEKAEIAKAHGADHVILYKQEDTVQRVLELTNGEGVHAIFDGVGKDTFEADFKMIRRKGTIVSVGNASGPVPAFPPLKLVEKNVRLVRPTAANYLYTAEEGRTYTAELFRLIADGRLKVRIHAEVPFTAEGVQQAEKDLVGGETVGKLVIKVGEP
ncbi:NAD-P-binding protein [Lentinus tigrinus ALCF2SS1-7]|uniref:Probable quinone oxidoreductase n=1 Tax=Lentinus tigrinus ALCF2SS1-6 TaxID=1328759 RepID=A0A5C2SRD2_9APHY|nr:NAD-P-binding protein [Lentinus tigrinus ALCF2SS1-6]RPD78953.1 NAD-P-binding protein [Lentinus tigrinus ALCF2SS1-7]